MNLSLMGISLKSSNKLIITATPMDDAKRFNINIGLGKENVALHIDVRFDYLSDYHTIVFNSKQNGSYASEMRDKHFLFQEAKQFQITITFNEDEFEVKIPGNYIVSFPNCFGKNEYKFIEVNGDVTIQSFNIE